MSLNCGWHPFRRALAWRCRRSSDGNSCSLTSVALLWHQTGRLAARSRDTTSCSLSCWYRRANHRRTAEPLGRAHSLGSSGSWYRSGLMLPRGNQPQEAHRAERETVKRFSLYFLCIIISDVKCLYSSPDILPTVREPRCVCRSGWSSHSSAYSLPSFPSFNWDVLLNWGGTKKGTSPELWKFKDYKNVLQSTSYRKKIRQISAWKMQIYIYMY